MSTAIFYLLSEQDAETNLPWWHVACDIAASEFRARRKVWVQCETKEQAEAFDELLWQRPANAFVPHNLQGEGPASGAPVVIAWEVPERVPRPVIINLHSNVPPVSGAQTIYDFVPAEEEQKPAARERYKQLRAQGFNMQTQTLSPAADTENHDG